MIFEILLKQTVRMFILNLYKVLDRFPIMRIVSEESAEVKILVYEKCPLLCALIKVSGSSLFSTLPFTYFEFSFPST